VVHFSSTAVSNFLSKQHAAPVAHPLLDDGSLLNGLQSIDAWQEYFDHPTSNILGLMNSAGFLPGLIVCWLADWFGYHHGRRYTVWLGSVFAVSR
jgi:hypothetical protein